MTIHVCGFLSVKIIHMPKYGLIGDTHSEVTIMPLEDLDFLQYQFLLTRKVMLSMVSY